MKEQEEAEYLPEPEAQEPQAQSEFDSFGYGNEAFREDPYTSNYQIDAKILSSDYKNQKIIIKTPKYKKMVLSTIYKNKDGTPKLVNGYPVEKDKVEATVLDGFETQEIDFPIQNLFNDSVTSSILTDSDVEMIRIIDTRIMSLGMKMVTNEKISFLKTLHLLNGIKASVADSSKGRWGRSAELSKTQINKGESRTYQYQDNLEFEQYRKRKQKKGILGFFGL